MPEEFLRLTLFLTTVSIFISVYVGVSLILRREPSLDDKLRKFTAWRAPLNPGRTNRSLKEILSALGRWAPRSWTERLDHELVRAGIPLKGGELLVLEGFLVFVGAGLGLALTSKVYAGVVAGSLGLILPRVWLRSAQKRKRKSFSNQLADALLILANSLKAGFSLLQAMEMVSREMPDPIAAEFQVTLREMTYGTPTEEALLRLSERVGSDDLDLLVTAILIQRQVGGNLAEVLLNIHATIQDRIRIQQEVKTLTAQGRTSGYIIAGLPFAIAGILMVINPSYLKLLVTEPLGLAMLGGGLVSQIIGFIVIRRIISIEV
ncbi:type II secretion system F family protein [Paradesulfitobacterium ferrireducens]|uniref:type II secretion system F family protein n=1 Tax=Paradesulfitobacterium ferrireducens TaxID=2816476 RepID=UPI001A8FA67E|nr:type II secretion system F family protein [Paradesulfitobacterium ferrireducens]